MSVEYKRVDERNIGFAKKNKTLIGGVPKCFPEKKASGLNEICTAPARVETVLNEMVFPKRTKLRFCRKFEEERNREATE